VLGLAVATQHIVLDDGNHAGVFLFHHQRDLRQHRIARCDREILGHDVAAAQSRAFRVVSVALASGRKIAANIVKRASLAFIAVTIASIRPRIAILILTVAGLVVVIVGAFAKAAAAGFAPSPALIFAKPSVWFIVGS